jgi:hypothetical protein
MHRRTRVLSLADPMVIVIDCPRSLQDKFPQSSVFEGFFQSRVNGTPANYRRAESAEWLSSHLSTLFGCHLACTARWAVPLCPVPSLTSSYRHRFALCRPHNKVGVLTGTEGVGGHWERRLPWRRAYCLYPHQEPGGDRPDLTKEQPCTGSP